jgi:ubiquinone/menaquinone biosynthesis C-methylase UbiE
VSFWRRAKFKLARALDVDLTHAQRHYSALLGRSLQAGDRWLDIGCGRQIVPGWAASEEEQRGWVERSQRLVGIDVDRALHEHPFLHNRVIALGDALPFRAETFELVTANVVVEHVQRPEQVLTEIRRVLVPGGRFVFHTPNYKYYLIFLASLVPDAIRQRLVVWIEKRNEADVFPTVYRMNTEKTIRRIAQETGFRILSLEVTGSVGNFGMLGPLGVLEVPLLKVLSWPVMKKWNSSILAVLVKAN